MSHLTDEQIKVLESPNKNQKSRVYVSIAIIVIAVVAIVTVKISLSRSNGWEGSKPPRISVESRSIINCPPNCNWELALAGNRKGNFAYASVGYNGLSLSSDYGKTWRAIQPLPTIPPSPQDPERRTWIYTGDPQVYVTQRGITYLLGNVEPSDVGFIPNVRSGGLYALDKNGNFMFSTLYRDLTPTGQSKDGKDLSLGATADYPKLAIDEQKKIMAIISLGGPALNISHDGGRSFSEVIATDPQLSNIVGSYQSIAIGIDGKIYIGHISRCNNEAECTVGVTTFDEATETFATHGIGRANFGSMVNVATSTSPPEFWGNVYRGPRIVVDKSKGRFRGRLYAIWSDPREIVRDQQGTYQYGRGYKLYVASSQDRGISWSEPQQILPGPDYEEQIFPAAVVDEHGNLHLAYVGRSSDNDLNHVNIMYTFSSDGGKSFSTPVVVNKDPLEVIPGRALGDYLDMMVAFKDEVFIAYQCDDPKTQKFGMESACLTKLEVRK